MPIKLLIGAPMMRDTVEEVPKVSPSIDAVLTDILWESAFPRIGISEEDLYLFNPPWIVDGILLEEDVLKS